MTSTDMQSARAMDTFLASVEKRAFRMAVIATRDRDEALDIVQDAMLKLARGYSRHEPVAWGPLFTRIMQSTILDWHRRQKVRNRWRVFIGGKQADDDDDDPMHNLAVAATPTPEQQTQQTDSIAALDAALQQLPVRQQQVFMLRQWEGMDVAEAARAMGITEGSVKTHYSRAVQALREKLEDHW